MREDVDAIVAPLAEQQHGVFARWQLAKDVATRRLIDRRIAAGHWQPAAPGVLRLKGTRPSWRQRVMIRCLAWGEGAVASHLAAGALWEFAGFRAGPIEVTVPRGRKRPRVPGRVHWATIDASDVTIRDGIPVTTAARTLIDLARTTSVDKFEIALDDALRRGLASFEEMRRLLDRNRGRRGNAIVRALLDEREGMAIPGSPFETMMLRAIKDAGLPRPMTQHDVYVGGELIGIIDFAFPDRKVGVEAEGFEFHDGRVRFDHDRRRRNALTVEGWLLVHVTWTEFKRRPESVIETIRQALLLRAQA